MKLACRKAEATDDWFLIEKAEHANKMWFEPMEGGGQALMTSGRISDADIEGTKEEMLALAVAIELRTSESFKRCAVRVNGDDVFLWSPRNSQREGHVSLADADELVKQMRFLLLNGEQMSINLGDDDGS